MNQKEIATASLPATTHPRSNSQAAARPERASYAQVIYFSHFSSVTYLMFSKVASSFICGRIQSKQQLPRAARQKGAGNLCWVRRVGRLKGDGILLCPSRKTLSPPDTQQKLSLPWRLAGNGLPVSQSCSWVTHRASCEQCSPVPCPSCKPKHWPHAPHLSHEALQDPCPCFLGWHLSLGRPWLPSRCRGMLIN